MKQLKEDKRTEEQNLKLLKINNFINNLKLISNLKLLKSLNLK